MLKLPDRFLTLNEKFYSKNYNLKLLKASFQKKYQSELKKQTWLTDVDLEMLILIDSYHKELTLHSFNTCKLVQEKLETNLEFSINLNSLLLKTNVSKTQLLRAALFHDIGKIIIPKTILYNETKNDELQKILLDLLFIKNDSETIKNFKEKTKLEIIPNKNELLSTLTSLGFRAVHIVPTKFLLTKAEKENSDARNLNLNLSLLDLIKIHEEASLEFLQANNFYTEGKLAGSHHDYKKVGSSFSLTFPDFSTTFDLVEIIRLADDISALTSSRAYNKAGFSLPKTWRIILEDLQAGKFNPILVYIWLEFDLKTFLQTTNLDNLTTGDLDDLKFIENNLNSLYEEIYTKSYNLSTDKVSNFALDLIS